MKLIKGAGFLFVLFIFTGCSNSTSNTYQCPMKCEGEKTYTSDVGCPICGMELKEI